MATKKIKPRYVTTSGVAALCSVSKAAVSNWIARGVKLDAPDAYLVDGRALWTEEHAKAMATRYLTTARERITAIEAQLAAKR